ncbi:MAG: hypothetical protein KDD33_01825 [Bdellovibrionales bacterium]|nr:hypothetical protein [Bdellovibrionales bacterium]
MGERRVPLQHFDIESLARSLKLASIDVIQTANTNIESHWYRSAGPVDLYYWQSHSKLVKVQINIYGQIVEWNEFDGVKTGYLKDESEEDIGRESVAFDKDANPFAVQQAIDFLGQVESIEGNLKQHIIRQIGFYNRWPHMRPTGFLSWLFRRLGKKS